MLTIITINHLLPILKLLGFNGSLSPPFQCTSHGSFSTAPAASTSSELSFSSHPYPLFDRVRLTERKDMGFRVWEFAREAAFEGALIAANSRDSLSSSSSLEGGRLRLESSFDSTYFSLASAIVLVFVCFVPLFPQNSAFMRVWKVGLIALKLT